MPLGESFYYSSHSQHKQILMCFLPSFLSFLVFWLLRTKQFVCLLAIKRVTPPPPPPPLLSAGSNQPAAPSSTGRCLRGSLSPILQAWGQMSHLSIRDTLPLWAEAQHSAPGLPGTCAPVLCSWLLLFLRHSPQPLQSSDMHHSAGLPDSEDQGVVIPVIPHICALCAGMRDGDYP